MEFGITTYYSYVVVLKYEVVVLRNSLLFFNGDDVTMVCPAPELFFLLRSIS